MLDAVGSGHFRTARQRSAVVCLSAEGIASAYRSERCTVRRLRGASRLRTRGWHRRGVGRVCCSTTHLGSKLVPNPQGAFLRAGRQPQYRHEASLQQDIRIRSLSRLGTRPASCAWRLGRIHTPARSFARRSCCWATRIALLRECGSASNSESPPKLSST